jgi:acyl-CoA reductase-like NAD-dependent aldehyde dehydrogenase
MSETFVTISPIDGSSYVVRPYAIADDIESTLAKAAAAQKSWKKVPLSQRKALCTKAINAFVAKKEQIAMEICWQRGRPIRSAAGEVGGFEDRARTMINFADQGLAPVQLEKKPGFARWIEREALGVVFGHSALELSLFNSNQHGIAGSSCR